MNGDDAHQALDLLPQTRFGKRRGQVDLQPGEYRFDRTVIVREAAAIVGSGNTKIAVTGDFPAFDIRPDAGVACNQRMFDQYVCPATQAQSSGKQHREPTQCQARSPHPTAEPR